MNLQGNPKAIPVQDILYGKRFYGSIRRSRECRRQCLCCFKFLFKHKDKRGQMGNIIYVMGRDFVGVVGNRGSVFLFPPSNKFLVSSASTIMLFQPKSGCGIMESLRLDKPSLS